MATGNGKFIVETTINCDVQADGKCKFFGTNTSGWGQSPHVIYVEMYTMKSTKVTVNCKKPDGTLCYVVPENDPIHQASTSAIAVAIKTPVTAVKEIDLLLTHDAGNFSLTNAAFTASFLKECSSSRIETSIPGQVRFIATLKTPRTIINQTNIASYTLRSNGNAPYGRYMINVDTSSKLFDAHHVFIDAHLGEQALVVVPDDKVAPSINSGLITTCNSMISGKAGAINDNFISLPNYIRLDLFKNDTLPIGETRAATNGSFTFDGIQLYNGEQLKIVASDFGGNSSVYRYSANISSDPNLCGSILTNTNNRLPRTGPCKENEIFVAPAYMHYSDGGSFGTTLEYTRFIDPRFGATIDAGVYYDKKTYSTQNSQSNTNFNIAAGVSYVPCKYPCDPEKRFSGNLHALAGLSNYTAKYTFNSMTSKNSEHSFTMVLGGAIDYNINPATHIRFQPDYTPVFGKGGMQSNFRLSLGVSYKF